jgi:NAD(P)-dependent dehydrogenase (short-subunit alcohol dehydrogenase family)
MGLAVATALSQRLDCQLHILDLYPPTTSLKATFHTCTVTVETTLSTIFRTILHQHQRRDSVFANAGIAERANFYDRQEESDGGPPLPVKGLHALVDINLKSVITTANVALHYMRKSSKASDKNIVMTASCGGLYLSYYSPIYTATKDAVVGFMRSITPFFYHEASVRVNAICPSTIKTNLLSSQEWENFHE